MVPRALALWCPQKDSVRRHGAGAAGGLRLRGLRPSCDAFVELAACSRCCFWPRCCCWSGTVPASSTSAALERPQKEGNQHGYGSIPIHTIFRGMNIHLPAILMFTRGIGFWPIPTCFHHPKIGENSGILPAKTRRILHSNWDGWGWV